MVREKKGNKKKTKTLEERKFTIFYTSRIYLADFFFFLFLQRVKYTFVPF